MLWLAETQHNGILSSPLARVIWYLASRLRHQGSRDCAAQPSFLAHCHTTARSDLPHFACIVQAPQPIAGVAADVEQFVIAALPPMCGGLAKLQVGPPVVILMSLVNGSVAVAVWDVPAPQTST
jgi:hypothetical protein